jgi:uncharacterized DUF497 family protein
LKRIVLTNHARRQIASRALHLEWVERVARNPLWREPDPFDPEVERRFAAIEEFGSRVLRVAVVETGDTIRVISAFFDRDARQSQ